jgi:hypothetical protein
MRKLFQDVLKTRLTDVFHDDDRRKFRRFTLERRQNLKQVQTLNVVKI